MSVKNSIDPFNGGGGGGGGDGSFSRRKILICYDLEPRASKRHPAYRLTPSPSERGDAEGSGEDHRAAGYEFSRELVASSGGTRVN